jgi:hypothetical protein
VDPGCRSDVRDGRNSRRRHPRLDVKSSTSLLLKVELVRHGVLCRPHACGSQALKESAGDHGLKVLDGNDRKEVHDEIACGLKRGLTPATVGANWMPR